MHEVGLVQGIVDAVQRRAGERPVAAVRVRIGALHRAVPGPMEQAFELVGLGTIVEGARLDLVEIPVVSRCAACGAVEEGREMVPVCPACGSTRMAFEGGDELILESIEYRAADAEPASAGLGGAG